ncbi:pyridoxamine 5'-phosphate oxidase family protein [Phaeovulum sp. W22_SRMD_FR3]|uniref:pyridoxamine 5'-phosphate oxidase family protein n=1 Tax=Phaeovulum sp. W22_SRMD_FR3 TaxID=3240274 RepID=UPI003F98E3B5
MSTADKLILDPIKTAFDQLDAVRVGMLGVEGAHHHMQPMTHHLDREEGALYFIASRDTDLIRDVGLGATAHYCLVGKEQDFHACFKGPLEQIEDEQRLNKIWSPFAAVWFDKGREDPKVCLLRLMLHDAEVWASDDNAVSVGWEMAKALLGAEDRPEIGAHRTIDFRTLDAAA